MPGGELRKTGNWGGRKAKYPNPDMKRYLDRMAERGFTAPMWPKEYGGGGLSPQQARVLQEEMMALKVAPPLMGMGLSMIGPTLLVLGTEAQKREYLPKICQRRAPLVPGLLRAGRRLRPRFAGDARGARRRRLRLTGTKIWTSYAHWADGMCCSCAPTRATSTTASRSSSST